MNKYLKKSAAVLLTFAFLATGCSNNNTEDSNSSETESESSISSTDTYNSTSSTSVVSSSTLNSSGESVSTSSGSTSASTVSLSDNSDGNSVEEKTDSNSNSSSNTDVSENVSSGFSFNWNAGNVWEEGGNKCGTVELKINNNSGKAISSWKISFNVPSGFKITNGWNATYSVNGTRTTASNVEYNGSIPNGGNVGIGFNYSSATACAPPSRVSINGETGSS